MSCPWIVSTYWNWLTTEFSCLEVPVGCFDILTSGGMYVNILKFTQEQFQQYLEVPVGCFDILTSAGMYVTFWTSPRNSFNSTVLCMSILNTSTDL